jgi:predicted transcriptional regulator
MSQEPQTKKKEQYTSIYISKQTRKVLGRIKLENDLRSYDEVIRMLLRRAGYADQQDG